VKSRALKPHFINIWHLDQAVDSENTPPANLVILFLPTLKLTLNFLVAETNIAARGKGEESLASGTALIEGCPLGSRESYIGI
jgi:hypothetical protein